MNWRWALKGSSSRRETPNAKCRPDRPVGGYQEGGFGGSPVIFQCRPWPPDRRRCTGRRPAGFPQPAADFGRRAIAGDAPGHPRSRCRRCRNAGRRTRCAGGHGVWVRVPVLSEQITVAPPRVSTAASRRMMARRRAMRETPMARVMVSAAGSPSGIAPRPGHGSHEHVGLRRADGPTATVNRARPPTAQSNQREKPPSCGEWRRHFGRGGDQAGDAAGFLGVAGGDHEASPWPATTVVPA